MVTMAPAKILSKEQPHPWSFMSEQNHFTHIEGLTGGWAIALWDTLKSWGGGGGCASRKFSKSPLRAPKKGTSLSVVNSSCDPSHHRPSGILFLARNIFYLSEIIFWLQANHYEPFSESLNRALKGINNYKNNSVTSAYILFYLVM